MTAEVTTAPAAAAAPCSGAGTLKLRTRGLTKSYGAVVALAPTDLDVREGEFMTLLGPSGSGKTTLLMMAAGLTPPTAGDIWIGGQLATRMPPARRDIGMVFQNYALFPHLSVFENVAFPLRMRRRPEAEIRREVLRVLEIVELAPFAQRLPRALSGGQQQRAALARSIVYAPSVVLMDEPLGALDKRLRDQLQIEIKRLHRSLGTTILYVTHDQQETLTMSDRICLMSNGRVEQVGTPQDLYFAPMTEFGARFLGESNLIDIDILSAGEDGTVFRAQAFGEQPLRAPTADVRPGDRVKLMLRPERLLVSTAAPEALAAANRVSATVTEIIFSGEVTKYFVRTDQAEILSVAQLTGWRRHEVEVGSRVTVSWDPQQSHILPRTAGS